MRGYRRVPDGQWRLFSLLSQHAGHSFLRLSRRIHAGRRLENLRRSVSHRLLSTLFTARFFTFSDIDECDYDPDDDQDRLCPGMCRNTIGSYVCVDPDEEPVTCQTGFEFHDEDGQCKGEWRISLSVINMPVISCRRCRHRRMRLDVKRRLLP